MMSRLFLLFSLGLLWASSALAQPGTNTEQWPDGSPGSDFNVTDADGLKQGRWIRVYPDGGLYYSGSFADGRPTGHFTFFRENGRVLSEVQHEVNTDFAKAILYRENGSISHKGSYLTVQLDGEWRQWKTGHWEALDAQGRIRVNEQYTRDTLDGAFLAYHPNGQVLESGLYAMGNKQGEWTAFDREGLARGSETWASGKKNGPAQVMQEGGKPLSSGLYEEGLPVGIWKTFNPNGRVRSLVTYEDGRVVSEAPQNGEFSSNYPSGRPEWVGRYAHGNLDGPFTAWYDAGEWTMVPAEEGGAKSGPPGMSAGVRPGSNEPLRRELRNQPMKEMGEYTAGVKDGPWRHFDEEGEFLRKETWTLGRLQSSEE
jgi:uncharacterized protein